MSISDLARPEVRALNPYEAAVQVDDAVRLNANEAPWTNDGDQFRRPLNRYPEVRPQGLRNILADRYGCARDQLLVTRGSSEAIDLLIRVFCRAGSDNIVTTSPTFSMYRHYAQVQNAEVREVETSRHDDFAVDVDALLAVCDGTTRLIFLCTPNNPTGLALPRERLVDLLQRRGNKSVVVVDEAYIEFSRDPSAIELLADYDNLLVLRTLSKALALAGARCGAVVGTAAIIDMLNAVQAPYALATPVVECVENALQAESLQEAESSCDTIIGERERLIDAIRQFPFVRHVWPSAANFFLVEVANVGALLKKSEADKILLRYFGGDLADCVRISVGTAAENDRLLEVFAAVQEVCDGH